MSPSNKSENTRPKYLRLLGKRKIETIRKFFFLPFFVEKEKEINLKRLRKSLFSPIFIKRSKIAKEIAIKKVYDSNPSIPKSCQQQRKFSKRCFVSSNFPEEKENRKEKTDKRCAWIRRPSKIDSSRKLGANGVARAWACQWRRCVDRFSRASRACMNSRGGKSIGLRPVRPYRRMCRIVRRTTEGDSIWSSSSFDERDRISKQFAEENEERIEEGRRIVRALSIAERVVTFRGGARRRGKGRSNYKTFDREQETDQGRNNRRGYESK